MAGKLDPVFKEYCSRFSPLIQKRLKELHQIISKAAPKADVVISYGMPAYKMENVIVYIAGYQNHISLYPTSSGIEAFKKELKNFHTSRGTVQFQHSEKIPQHLITRIVKFRIKETASSLKTHSAR